MPPSPSTNQQDEQPDETWNLRFQELLKYRKKHGHCVVPQRFAQNKLLGRWVAQQRQYYQLIKKGRKKTTPLWNLKQKQLNQVGFVWYVGTNQRDDVIAQVMEKQEKKKVKKGAKKTINKKPAKSAAAAGVIAIKKRPSARVRALQKKKVAQDNYKALVTNKKRSSVPPKRLSPRKKQKKSKETVTTPSCSSRAIASNKKKKVIPAAEFCVTPEAHDLDTDVEVETSVVTPEPTELNDHDLELARLIANFPSHHNAASNAHHLQEDSPVTVGAHQPQFDHDEMNQYLDIIASLQQDISKLQQELMQTKATTQKVQNQVLSLLLGSSSFTIHPTNDGSEQDAILLVE